MDENLELLEYIYKIAQDNNIYEKQLWLENIPEDIYNEHKNRFVAKFIGESNIIRAEYVGNKKVSFMGSEFECVDENFQPGEACDVVIRP